MCGEALTFLLNGVVFALIGLQLPLVLSVIRGNYSWPTLLSYAGIFSVFLIALRLVWVYPAAWLTYFIRRRLLRQRVDPPNPKSVFVIGWTGMLWSHRAGGGDLTAAHGWRTGSPILRGA